MLRDVTRGPTRVRSNSRGYREAPRTRPAKVDRHQRTGCSTHQVLEILVGGASRKSCTKLCSVNALNHVEAQVVLDQMIMRFNHDIAGVPD